MATKQELSAEARAIEEYLERAEARTAPGWRPTIGDAEIGAEVIGLAIRTDSKWGEYPMVTYKRPNGSVFTVHAFHQVLRDRFRELETDIGSKHNLVYLGTRPHSTNKNEDGTPKEYNMYDVENFGDTSVGGKEEGFHF